jgi:raffinose/stachyose/melibiose transport system permease protein
MKKKNSWFYLFIAPIFIALIMVIVVPLVLGIYYSFTNWNGIQSTKMVGFANYVAIFHDKGFIDSLWFTVKFTIISIVLTNLIGLSLALIVTQKFKGNHFLRTVFFMPNLIGGLILGFIWQFIFIKAFSSVGDLIGMASLKDWLATPDTGFWGLVILMSWQYSGYIMVIYIAYLEGMDRELLEAAEIDGANIWQRFRHIIVPLIAPAFTVNLFLTLSNSFKMYDQNLSLTAGGPYNSTQMVAMNIFNTAFGQNQMAFGQAKAVVFFVVIAAVSLTQVYYSKKREVEL